MLALFGFSTLPPTPTGRRRELEGGTPLLDHVTESSQKSHRKRPRTFNPKIFHVCKNYFQFEKIQKLCKEPGHSSAPRPENICSHINYQDPYLKLGPFRLEHLNTEPAVEVFHNIIYDDEIKWIKETDSG